MWYLSDGPPTPKADIGLHGLASAGLLTQVETGMPIPYTKQAP